MYRQTLWYTDDINTVVVVGGSDKGKQYELQRPYHYGGLSTSNIQLYNSGVNDTPMLIEIDGRCTDPLLSLYDNEKNLYGRSKILGTYDYVAINSDDLEEEITLIYNGGSIPNAVNFQDLSVGDPRKVFVTFLKMRPGQNTLVTNLPDGFDGRVIITWRNAYVAV